MKKATNTPYGVPKSAKLTLAIMAVGTVAIMGGLIYSVSKKDTSPESTSAATSKCFGQCKGDNPGQYYDNGKICTGMDDKCYKCQSGKFNVIPTSNCSITTTETTNPTTTASCTGQCKGDKTGSKYVNGYTCYGTNGTTCYRCQNGKFNTVSTIACANTINTNSCTGQCKGDSASSKYPNGYTCTGMDGKCYRCDNGKFNSYTSSTCANLTPYCKGQCRGDSASSTYSNGFKCYGGDGKCYQCASGKFKTITSTNCR